MIRKLLCALAVLVVPVGGACSGGDDDVGFGDAGPTDAGVVDAGPEPDFRLVAVTFNTGTTMGLRHDDPADDGYGSDQATTYFDHHPMVCAVGGNFP